MWHLGQRYKFQTTCDRSYPLSEIPAAIRYLEQAQVKGKVAIQVVD
ncbi:MAG: zinc-binding dehydrogenase [Methylacidiphilales bacterium]|nr:zinc-binding dehydrogenase [Candidatus Methylacidiphilales bacterium]NJR19406.1 zinc-binding dehydrogenase [Calothrix sp. CSU_2_0]